LIAINIVSMPASYEYSGGVHQYAPSDDSLARDRFMPSRNRLHFAILALLATAIAATFASAADLHQYWDQRCKDCHGHAGDFARAHLSVQDGKLIGRHHAEDLLQFLRHHESGGAYAEPIHAMLLAQASTVPVYRQKCAGCHENAAELVRTSIERDGNVLLAKSSRRPISALLLRHGKVSPEEAAIVLQSLERVFNETHGPSGSTKP
jgi:hypothetical protein